MHLCFVGGGVNSMGYYMYHGGNNPHSTVHTGDMDAPNTTLQESSFQPAGASNPMPSASYDFFAPLGEFGQPRQHYHQMRRLHNLLANFPDLADTATHWPADVASPDDPAALRWVVRVGSNHTGFVFVNNYERLKQLPPKTQVRLSLVFNDTATPLAVPALKSAPLTIGTGLFAAWPLGYPLVAGLRLVYATAELQARVRVSPTEEILFFVESDGVPPEFAVATADADKVTVVAGRATASTEGAITVLRKQPGNACAPGDRGGFAKVVAGGQTLVLVAQSLSLSGAHGTAQLYSAELGGEQRVLATDPCPASAGPGQSSDYLLLADNTTLHIRGDLRGASNMTFSMAPPLSTRQTLVYVNPLAHCTCLHTVHRAPRGAETCALHRLAPRPAIDATTSRAR